MCRYFSEHVKCPDNLQKDSEQVKHVKTPSDSTKRLVLCCRVIIDMNIYVKSRKAFIVSRAPIAL